MAIVPSADSALLDMIRRQDLRMAELEAKLEAANLGSSSQPTPIHNQKSTTNQAPAIVNTSIETKTSGNTKQPPTPAKPMPHPSWASTATAAGSGDVNIQANAAAAVAAQAKALRASNPIPKNWIRGDESHIQWASQQAYDDHQVFMEAIGVQMVEAKHRTRAWTPVHGWDITTGFPANAVRYGPDIPNHFTAICGPAHQLYFKELNKKWKGFFVLDWITLGKKWGTVAWVEFAPPYRSWHMTPGATSCHIILAQLSASNQTSPNHILLEDPQHNKPLVKQEEGTSMQALKSEQTRVIEEEILGNPEVAPYQTQEHVAQGDKEESDSGDEEGQVSL